MLRLNRRVFLGGAAAGVAGGLHPFSRAKAQSVALPPTLPAGARANALLDALPGKKPLICALRVWPDFEGHSNQELRYALGRATPFPGYERQLISPHRAAFDVVVTAAIFEELIKKARWSELVQWSAERIRPVKAALRSGA
jgi:hypothetical protein